MRTAISDKPVGWIPRRGIWLLLTLLLLPSVAMSSGMTARVIINMQPRVTVANDSILLGDIAIIRGPDTVFVADLNALVVGRAPLPGKSRQINAAYVAMRLRQKGISINQVALNETTTTTVVRDSTFVSRKQIEDAIREALDQEDFFQGRRGVVRDIRVNSDLVVPSGNVSYGVKFTEKPIRSNRVLASVSVYVNGKHYRKIWGTIVADILQEVMVLSKTMRRHQRITGEDIQLVAMNLTDIPHNAITVDQDILGKRVTKSLLSGTVLRTDIVELPPLVKRGDVVTIAAESGVLQVTALGKAKSNGRQGERIKVLNIDTQKELYGFVVDAKTVKVVF